MTSSSGTAGALTSEREAAAVQRWMDIQGELQRGIGHAMSNRIAALSASAFVLREKGVASSEALTALQSEIDQLEQLLLQLRLLPRNAEIREPLLARDSARTALALLAHYESLRDVACSIDDPEDIPPARAEPQALVQALVVALTAARTAAGATNRAVLELRADDEHVRFIATVEGAADAVSMSDSPFEVDADAARWLLRGSAGRAWAHASGCVVEVPTLAASRRTER